MMRARAGGCDALLNILLAFFILLLQSWIADGIKGDQLFPWLPGGALGAGGAGFWWWMLAMALLSLACAGVLYKRRRTFLPVAVQRIGQPGRVEPHAVLVLALSHTAWQWQPDRLTHARKPETHTLPPALPAALAVMAALGEHDKFSWEQLLRAIREHQPRLQRVLLVCSSGTGGSAASFPACRKMITHYFPQLDAARVEMHEASFEALDELLALYHRIIAEEASRKREIMIDVTGGTKVLSVAAAMVTLEHPEIEFQYVETAGDKRVRTFNVIAGSAGGEET
jgi:hypothetical protein